MAATVQNTMQNMKNILLLLMLLFPAVVAAQNWDHIRNSGEYYYGDSDDKCKTLEEATNQAISNLSKMIAVNVSSTFTQVVNEKNSNGDIDSESRVLNCVKSYSQATLTNVEKWVVSGAPDFHVRCYMKRSELSRIFSGRIDKAKDMLQIAEGALQKRKIDMALQYYYWAYSLVRTVQYPDEVKDEKGRSLVNYIPLLIKNIISEISVAFEKREGDYVDLLFTYKNEPVSSLDFSYNDGRARCDARVKDGRGMIEMVPGYKGNLYRLQVEYEYKEQASGDSEMDAVLNVVNSMVMPEASMVVKGDGAAAEKVAESKAAKVVKAQEIKPLSSQLAIGAQECEKRMNAIVGAIKSRNYSTVASLSNFTLDGLEVFNELIAYGSGRIIGTPDIRYFKAPDSTVVARGLQMSFSFKRGTKTTFVEDVAFYFDKDGKVDNVAFGLGVDATNGILCKKASGWSTEAREILMSFLENYKTAYCLRRHEYISTIFSDDAVIIVGKVLKRKPAANPYQEREISIKGQEIITYNKYNKADYLTHLERVFRNNEFINIRFSDTGVQKMTKFEGKEIYAIQLGQEYNSSIYADKGYLFLLVDITDKNEPLIKIRTWQPNEVDLDSIYNAGDFYRN